VILNILKITVTLGKMMIVEEGPTLAFETHASAADRHSFCCCSIFKVGGEGGGVWENISRHFSDNGIVTVCLRLMLEVIKFLVILN
jgi:hypothetical protein